MNTENTQFTDSQVLDFCRFVKVQKSGKYNMLSPQAINATGLSRERYMFVMENYDALAAAYEGAK